MDQGGISELALMENQRVTEKTNSLMLLSGDCRDTLTLRRKLMNTVSVGDLELLERKLDCVIRNEKELPQHHSLQEEKRMEASLMKGKIEYYKLLSRGKAPPLRVSLQRETGAVIVCVSGTEMFPDRKSCNDVFSGDVSFYYPKSSKSFSEFTYLSVFALENCKVSILVRF